MRFRRWVALPWLLAVALGFCGCGLVASGPPEVTPPPEGQFLSYACSNDLSITSNWSLAIVPDGNATLQYMAPSETKGITTVTQSFSVDPATLATLVRQLDAARVPRFVNRERMVGGDCLLVYKGQKVFLDSLPAPLQSPLALLNQILDDHGLPSTAARPSGMSR